MEKLDAVALPIIVTPISSTEWKLMESLQYTVFKKSFIVPAGFITDFASVPRIFWSRYAAWDIHYGPPAILHDFLYQGQVVPRKEADEMFLELMRLAGVSLWTRYRFYFAVRMFGAWAYADRDARGK